MFLFQEKAKGKKRQQERESTATSTERQRVTRSPCHSRPKLQAYHSVQSLRTPKKDRNAIGTMVVVRGNYRLLRFCLHGLILVFINFNCCVALFREENGGGLLKSCSTASQGMMGVVCVCVSWDLCLTQRDIVHVPFSECISSIPDSGEQVRLHFRRRS